MKLAVFLLILYLLNIARCYRILVVFPVPARSHYILGRTLAKGLAEAGHDVTIISSFKEENPPKNVKYRDIVLSGMFEEFANQSKINFFDMGDMNPFLNIPLMNYIGNQFTKGTFENSNFKELIKSNEYFDAVIVEQFNNDALKVLGYHYKAPLILFSTIGASGWVNPLVGNPSPPSYIPDAFLSYTSNMTFWQRVVNILITIATELNRQLILFPTQNNLMKEHFPNAPDLSTLLYNVSLVLMNSHESINQPVPHVPNMIDIGGYHVTRPKELSKDLKNFMDNAEEGVVYFSMGSNIKPSDMSKDKKDHILKALGKIKEKVLWKWDEDDLSGKPPNVRLGKWFPQQDILAHPNIKVFITHGGLLSTTETVYYGVPILALPVFGDQKLNAARAETAGYGISLVFSELTEEIMSDALNKLLNDPKYRENAKIRSKLMHDRPMKPMDLAVYWTEFIIRHRGAPHLKIGGLDLPWYKYLSLDVILFITLVSLTIVALFIILVKKFCCAATNTKKKVKKN